MNSNLLFDLAKANEPTLVGGKAHALAQMIGAGFTVPEGFVVSTEAFNSLTPELKAAILKKFDALQSDLVAVRSSAIGEDASDAAWAGQLETFLNTSRTSLLKNIELCWQSIESNRAKSYADQKSLTTGKVAVIVQKMIQSEVSGVAFSVDPISQNADQLVIDAGFGLGEAIVSGEITPDSYSFDKTAGKMGDKWISPQDKQLIRNASGKTTWEPVASGKQQKLSDAQIAELSQLVIKLETFFGYPIDVEWALSNGTFYILQSRPITTLN